MKVELKFGLEDLVNYFGRTDIFVIDDCIGSIHRRSMVSGSSLSLIDLIVWPINNDLSKLYGNGYSSLDHELVGTEAYDMGVADIKQRIGPQAVPYIEEHRLFGQLWKEFKNFFDGFIEPYLKPAFDEIWKQLPKKMVKKLDEERIKKMGIESPESVEYEVRKSVAKILRYLTKPSRIKKPEDFKVIGYTRDDLQRLYIAIENIADFYNQNKEAPLSEGFEPRRRLLFNVLNESFQYKG